MTDAMMNLRSLVEKSPDADLLREMIGLPAERLMEMGAAAGAGYGEKNPLRTAQRNGYRDGDWETRAGTVELQSSGRAPTSRPLWIDATYLVRRGGRIVLVAVIIAVAVNTDEGGKCVWA